MPAVHAGRERAVLAAAPRCSSSLPASKHALCTLDPPFSLLRPGQRDGGVADRDAVTAGALGPHGGLWAADGEGRPCGQCECKPWKQWLLAELRRPRSAHALAHAVPPCCLPAPQVCTTIHQPSSLIASHFDTFLLLHAGSCVYNGPWPEAVPYFAARGHPCPQVGGRACGSAAAHTHACHHACFLATLECSPLHTLPSSTPTRLMFSCMF